MSELQKAVADMLVKATQAAEAAGKFAVEQLPDVAHQYVMYIGIKSTVYASLWAIAVGICLWLIRWGLKNLEGGEKGVIMFPVLVGILCMMPLISYIDAAILAFLAPKVLLIQWAAELVK